MTILIYTDLDGTLLDHETYSASGASMGIQSALDAGAVIIPVTSKTRAEVEPLMGELNWGFPFIVENGSAVFLPEWLCTKVDCHLPSQAEYRVKAFSPTLAEWQPLIDDLAQALPGAFQPFSQLDVARVIALTGLSEEHAARALQREFSDPLYWLGTDQQFQQLHQFCVQKGVDVVRGGRFVHLLQGSDKGRAVRWLTDWYDQRESNKPQTIALGDGENDLSMLAAVDHPVQVRSPSHAFPDFEHPNRFRTQHTGPEGWSEAIASLLARID
ncbi:HAD-IIB family hydrolase [Reinekea blandensis]|uniref:HAD-IIB family hydrolase n=1 Tax=Reinekea blandensis TaxID=374838 RepID=UPI00058F757B|nr:HAD-IIB family hydrolase [Reinekea blandensis]